MRPSSHFTSLSPVPGRPRRRRSVVIGLVAGLSLGPFVADAVSGATSSGPVAPAAALSRKLSVSYISTGAIYLDGGRREGVTVGARLEVRRQGEGIALLEVAFVADHSASCRLISQTRAPQVGDPVILLSPAAIEPDDSPPPGQPAEPRRASPPIITQTPQTPRANTLAARKRTRVSGVLSVGTQQFTDTGAIGGGYGESTGRLSLRLRNIQGRPLDLRVRTRSRQIDRDPGPSGLASSSSRSDRLYELSLSYTPEEGRYAWAVGRLGASPFVSVGYLDGALGQFRLSRRFFVGAFFGSRPEVAELGLTSAGTKYGGYVRFSTPLDQRPSYAEVVLAGIGEYGTTGEASREYIALESRFGSGHRWTLFQRAELDLNRGWRQEIAGSASQISNASLSASYRFNPKLRAQLTYDQRRDYLTLETRPRPEEVFDRFLRQGVRGSFEWEGASGWNATLGAGSERDDSGGEATTSASLSVYHANLFRRQLTAGIDLSTYSGGVAEGYVTTLRLRRYFTGGHDLGLTLGASQASLAGLGATRRNQWVRLSGNLQLPRRFYLFGELELDTGDDLEGQRYILELGYQF